MTLKELLDRRLIIISGKGGVGKTSLSVMLAMLSAALNKKALIIEMNSTGRISPIFKVFNSPKHEEINLTENISTINLSPHDCFKEYAIKLLHFAALYKTFFTNRYVANFINAVPGLDEFMMMAKIDELESKAKHAFSSQHKYDVIIVDAPATGHGLSILEVPSIIASAIKIGPPHKQAIRTMDMLKDKSRTAFSLITLAEEMPVSESEEYINALRQKTELGFGPLFINAIMPAAQEVNSKNNLPYDLKIFMDYYNLTKSRAALNQFYIEEIKKRFPDFHKLIIPFQFNGLKTESDFTPVVRQLIKEL